MSFKLMPATKSDFCPLCGLHAEQSCSTVEDAEKCKNYKYMEEILRNLREEQNYNLNT